VVVGADQRLDTNLRGVSVRYNNASEGKHPYVVWASIEWVILRSMNDGSTWKQLHVAGGSELDFRDIESF